MKTVRVSASREYDVLIGAGVLSRLGAEIASRISCRTAALVSDDTVFSLYGEAARKSLENAGFSVVPIVFPHGERSKNLETYGRVLGALCENHLTRSDIIVALGGGVTGDLAGFAAATYQRGIRFVQVPTTLLAAVDSSVGGKTAVDIGAFKNQVGAFWQPSLVLCDTETLKTLPEEEYRCGCAEIIKYAMLGDAEFFASLLETPVRENAEAVIEKCVSMKRDFVAQDEFDTGCRKLLNLGHTFGHAIEACSDFSVLHGQGVAAGMAIITKAAVKKDLCSAEALNKLLEILEKYGLPTGTSYPAADLAAAALSDKKASGAKIDLIVPTRVGECRVIAAETVSLREWLNSGGVN